MSKLINYIITKHFDKQLIQSSESKEKLTVEQTIVAFTWKCLKPLIIKETHIQLLGRLKIPAALLDLPPIDIITEEATMGLPRLQNNTSDHNTGNKTTGHTKSLRGWSVGKIMETYKKGVLQGLFLPVLFSL